MATKPKLTLLTREQLLAAEDLTTDTVEVPEWGGSVEVRTLSKGEQMLLRKQATVGGNVDTDRLELLMVVRGMTNPKLEVSDIEALRGKNAGNVDKVLKRIMTLSGFSAEEVEAAKATFQE